MGGCYESGDGNSREEKNMGVGLVTKRKEIDWMYMGFYCEVQVR